MSIIYGFKVESPADKSYTFAENEVQAKISAERNNWEEYNLIPCRYIKTGKYGFLTQVNEENKIQTLYKLFTNADIQVVENTVSQWQNPVYFLWDAVIEAGKSYMVGLDVDTKRYLKTHTSQTSEWQIIACEYAKENPNKKIILTTGTKRKFCWTVFLEGDHVMVSLPHHDRGGEKDWAVHVDCLNKKVLVNVD